ncbi:Ppx/GppA phosphatase [Hypoxylon rubiginosum]|uniref:Ppx/GppA phosphatase n=1 Tax=Hypoxylon rubiginosum TaxID=110542 RepID=A0ACC0D3G6_9PEZI|nr:Ppx/GppA phosphatase [Hypoxylon rubiginosum]
MASPTDIITLDNFVSKLPPWEPNLPNHLYALVDMGSNGIRFSVSDLSPPNTRLLRCLYRERAAISLFDDLNASSTSGPLAFSPDVITQVSQTLARFKSIAIDHGVPTGHISVLATEAMRKAENAASMLTAILEASGLGVHILAPEVETLFGAMGARSGFTSVNGLFLDLGGGSVQMTYLNSSEDGYEMAAAQSGKSLPFGAAKLIKILDGGETEAQAEAVNTLQEGMRTAFAKLQQQFPSLRDVRTNEDAGIDIFLCGGGFRGYGSILMHTDAIQPYPIPAVGAYTVQGSSFASTKAMRKVNRKYDGKIFGMSKRRRQQFPAIATVVEALIDAIPPIRTATFCSGGNREGALFMKLPKAMREENPLPLLHQVSDKVELDVLQSVIDVVQSSLHPGVDRSNIPTVFSLGLGSLFVNSIWTRFGESGDANAAFELHQATTRDPSTPSFTHLARAILGLTLCNRWGAGLGPIDKILYANLQELVARANPDAYFLTEYIGAVARLIAMVCPTKPNTPDKLGKILTLSPVVKNGKVKEKQQLVITLSPEIHRVLEPQDLVDLFKNVGRHGNSDRKVDVMVKKFDF